MTHGAGASPPANTYPCCRVNPQNLTICHPINCGVLTTLQMKERTGKLGTGRGADGLTRLPARLDLESGPVDAAMPGCRAPIRSIDT